MVASWLRGMADSCRRLRDLCAAETLSAPRATNAAFARAEATRLPSVAIDVRAQFAMARQGDANVTRLPTVASTSCAAGMSFTVHRPRWPATAIAPALTWARPVAHRWTWSVAAARPTATWSALPPVSRSNAEVTSFKPAGTYRAAPVRQLVNSAGKNAAKVEHRDSQTPYNASQLDARILDKGISCPGHGHLLHCLWRAHAVEHHGRWSRIERRRPGADVGRRLADPGWRPLAADSRTGALRGDCLLRGL